jgi:hypothetical protein
MTNVLRLLCAALVAALLVPVAPVVSTAGEREVAYLRSLAGNYVGSGRLRGAGTVTCRLALKPSGGKLNFSGRCKNLSEFSGTITYDDRRKRWISTSRGQSVAGRRSGRSLTFTTTERRRDGVGATTTTFSPGKVSMKVQLKARGAQASVTISFRPS